MTTHDNTEIQKFMRDLNKRQQELGEQLQAFETLQQEIARLKQLAPNDIQARQRLNRLSGVMQRDFAPLYQRFQHCAQSLHSQLESLEVSLRNAERPVSEQATAVSRRKSPLVGRAFF
ncbi:MAG: DUF3958 family protein [Burkholderiaceae bacterium]|nr:DUF3958 family protein [Burkholderiaceae bacterium]